ncbi:retrovirus-related pol polyprotein from transposon TNT 1-94 [Tanacetum coccineum]
MLEGMLLPEGKCFCIEPQTLVRKPSTSAQKINGSGNKRVSVQETMNRNRMLEEKGNSQQNNNYQNNYNNRNNHYHQKHNRRQEAFKIYSTTNGYTGNRPLCERCTLHHIGPCTVKCQTCSRVGHLTKNCRNQRPTTRNDLQTVHVTRISTLETTLGDIQVSSEISLQSETQSQAHTPSLKKFKKRSLEELKPRSKDTRRTSGNTTRNDPFPPFLIIEAQTQVIEQVRYGIAWIKIGISAMVIENKVKTLTINHISFFSIQSYLRALHSRTKRCLLPTTLLLIIEDAFSSMNILNYTSVSPDYFPASSGSSSFNSLKNSTDNMIPPVFSSFYNNPSILTPSPILPPSLLFDPRYFFVPEELLPPKKRICSSSSSSTTLSNSSWNQTCDLVSPSSSVYTPTPPQIFEIGKCSDKMYLKHHEGQIEDILNYLDELYLHHIEKMEEGRCLPKGSQIPETPAITLMPSGKAVLADFTTAWEAQTAAMQVSAS